MITSKTFRIGDKWVKVTRDKTGFYFAVGNKGEIKSHREFKYSFEYIKTWNDAKDLAFRTVQ